MCVPGTIEAVRSEVEQLEEEAKARVSTDAQRCC